jgi:PAS domain S-box-containing protein
LILVTAAAGTWKWNPDSDIVEVSGHLRALLGYTGPEARAACLDHWLAHVHPDQRDSIRAQLEAARDAGAAPLEAELRLLAQDGSAHWFAMRADWQPQDNAEGRLLLGACVDVDALKTAEAARAQPFHPHP